MRAAGWPAGLSPRCAPACVAPPAAERPGVLLFPGGGIFFWWQAGVIAALAERGYDFRNSRSMGVSAGALAATLATCGVDMDEAFDRAAAASTDLFDRGPWALQGVWGGIIRQWLDDLLPYDAAERCSSRVHILTREAPCLHTRVVSSYADRDDLIHANMASVHIPCAPRTARARTHTPPRRPHTCHTLGGHRPDQSRPSLDPARAGSSSTVSSPLPSAAAPTSTDR